MRAVIFILITFCGCTILHAQYETPVKHATIDSILVAENFDEADRIIQKNIRYYFENGPLDSLYAYPLYIGKVAIAKEGKNVAERKAITFISDLKKKTNTPRTLFKTYLSLDKLYLDLADDEGATKAATTALEYAKKTPDITNEELGRIHYILGGDYYALYDDPNALKNFERSVYYYEKSPTVAKHTLADSYNGVAIGMWVLNRLDSAEVYYRKAIKMAEKSDLKGYDKAFYVATFQFNLALVIDDQGRVSEAISIKKSILKVFQEIIANSKDEELVENSKRREAGAIANLAAFYNDIGYVERGYEMIKYSYEKKKALYPVSDPNLISVLNRIAGSEVSLRLFDKSLETIALAFTNLQKSTEAYPAIEAELFYMKAKAYEGKQDTAQAKRYFEESELLYRKAYPLAFSRAYLTMLRNYAQFLAHNGFKEAACEKAEKTYAYVSKNVEDGNITLLKELVSIAEVYFIAGNYEQSLLRAEEANAMLDAQLKKTENALDSIQIEYRRPDITQLEVASRYKLQTNKTPEFLTAQIEKLEKAVRALERRRSTSTARADVTELLEEYSKINQLLKKMNYELYLQTNDPSLPNKILTLQESGVYHRIRTQLNTQEEISFNKVPESILKQEREFKKVLSLQYIENDFNIATYLEQEQAWIAFLELLKQKHPTYYNLKYASLEVPIEDLRSQIPENTTVLRYFFMEDALFVFLISATQKELIKLPAKDLTKQIKALAQNWQDAPQTGKIANQIYRQIWEPFAQKITTDKVIVIPDGALYNLSFEMLTTSAITSFEEFATKSLLAGYSISYNFSTSFLDTNKKMTNFSENYVGFAPEFTSEMKEGYSLRVTDSLATDKTYLTLLPQPFISKVANTYSRQFNGTSFLNENASKSVFLHNAPEHKIIHIGTHAESNNAYPELSRLIFAKELTSNSNELGAESNSLYTYEIYNTNLSSNLAILTACETGKPEFQPGEGMISLAHAFTYAGSESILTSLWQIDEQASAKITGLFFDNLKDGMPKDKALQKAKLDYLLNAKGRMAAPQYWAGLVLIGNTSAIDLSSSSSISVWFWVLGALLLLTLLIFFVSRRK